MTAGLATVAWSLAAGSTADAVPDLGPNQALTPGHGLTLGSYVLLMKKDGNLVASEEGRGQPFWQTGTGGHPGSRAVMQGDGNLVVYDPNGSALWSTGPAGPGTCLMGSATNGFTVVDKPGDPYNWWPLWSLAPCYEGSGTRVAVVGDSITMLSQSRFASAFDPRYAFEVSGMPLYRFADQLPAEDALLRNPTGSPPDVIVNLGTNDVIDDNPAWRSGMDDVLRRAGSRCLLLVTVSDRADDDAVQPGTHLAGAVNDALRTWARSHRRVHVIPWAALLRADDYGWVEPDGIHPNTDGDAELASLYRQALDRYCSTDR